MEKTSDFNQLTIDLVLHVFSCKMFCFTAENLKMIIKDVN